MIHLLPYLEEQIYSDKTPEDICMILQSVTDSRKVAIYANAEFYGQVHLLDFRIAPRLNYRNSFVPVLTGKMTEKKGGTAIEITLRMHILTRVLITLWNGMACFCFLCAVMAVFTGGLEQMTLIIVSLGLLILGQAFPRCCFYGPAKNALKRLKELILHF